MTFPKIAILISGTGSNMESIVKACKTGELKAEVTFVGSSSSGAKGLQTAASYGIDTCVFNYKSLEREKAEKEIIEKIIKTNSEWIILAGFMRVLSPAFVKRFTGKIINIHPSLLPLFPGAHGIEDAWNSGIKVSGVTIHIVDEGVDTGPILAQEKVLRLPNDTIELFEERIHQTEHMLYKSTLKKLFAENKKNK